MHDDTRQRHEDWLEKVRFYEPEEKLGRAEHLWNEYQHRHNLVWSLVFRLTAAVVVLAVIPYTQEEVMKTLGRSILLPPILGVVLAVVGFFRVLRELQQLDHIRELYWRLQDSLFYQFHPEKSGFRLWILFYIFILTALAAINVLIVNFCWIPRDA